MNHDRRYRLWTLLVIVAAAATYFVGAGSVHLWDRDEAWYAQASKQMVESGNWLVTYFLDQPRYSKPIFVYWCQALCMTLLGPTERAARLPSAIAMTVTLSILACSIGRALGARRAFYTVLVFSSSVMVIASAKMCLTDSVLLTFMTAAQLSLFAIYWRARLGTPDPESRIPIWLPIVFWLAVALAGLTKGPIVLAVLMAALIALACLDAGEQWRSLAAWKSALAWWRNLRPLLGILIIAVIVAPWLIAASVRDPAYVKNMLLEPLRHTTSNQDGQWMLPGYYLVAIWPTFFPWCVLLPPAFYHAWRRRRASHIRFALALILGNWLLAEAMVTKLPHYLLPSFVALAFLTADVIQGVIGAGALARVRRRLPFDRLAIPATLLWIVGAMALAAAPMFIDAMLKGPRLASLAVFFILAVGYVTAVAALLLRRQFSAAVPVMGLGMLLIVALLYAVVIPRAWYLRMPVEVGHALRDLGATRKGDVIMTGFFEPSLAFYQGGTIRERPREYLALTSPAEWPHWIVATEGLYHALDPDRSARLRIVRRFQGINYNAGARSDLYARVDSTETHFSTIAGRQGNEYKSLLRIETVLILEKRAP